MYWLEGGSNLRVIFSEPQFRPTELTITIRYSDWWWWENNVPMTMKETWLCTFKGSPGLRRLRVEYETLSWKKAEMMRIVERNKKWKLPVRCEGDDSTGFEGYLTAEKTELQEWTWHGTSKLGGRTWSHHGKGEKDETVEYVVVTDTWKFVEDQLSEEEMRARGISGPDMSDGDMSDEDMSDEEESEEEPSDEEFSDEEGTDEYMSEEDAVEGEVSEADDDH
tara:strand:- start:2018 stop:2683 length:666 start_codon:yes stop_codon:yes gene_type:complete